METYCNPLDLGYRYQHHKFDDVHCAVREGADPTLVFFKNRYYMFVSMAAGFWYSDDLLHWKFHANEQLLMYDYAPDARQIGDFLYLCASRWKENCPILRTKDPLLDELEEVSAPFPFWDPDIFADDDGRVYLYWGCSNNAPLYGIELDAETMLPIGEKVELIFNHEDSLGYERLGENGRPYIEGAFLTKHKGRYYLQYACPGTEFHTYCDGVYVAEAPLGPYTLQADNPFSSKPGGFIAGAGHGSTIADAYGNYWHAATMRISVSHLFERRVGLFPAGFDKDGILFCNQNFADYPHRIPRELFDAAQQQPEWMLLSYRKPATASSSEEGSGPHLAVNEDIRSWWSAGRAVPGEWLAVDLEEVQTIRAIQVNLADEGICLALPPEAYANESHTRHIDTRPQISRYRIESSQDGEEWELLEEVRRECSNGYYEYPAGITARFVRIVAEDLPYGQVLRISGLRVFGISTGARPEQVKAKAFRQGALDALVSWNKVPGAQGYNVRYGIAADKLYHSWLVYDTEEVRISMLMKDKNYYICVDSFNENGITRGEIIRLE